MSRNQRNKQFFKGKRQMVNGSGLQVPGRVQVGVQHIAGPGAYPQAVTIGGSGSVQLLIAGGMTKVEVVATQVLSAMLSRTSMNVAGDRKAIVDGAVATARELLAACESVESTPSATPGIG
jgi:hypothetical protein